MAKDKERKVKAVSAHMYVNSDFVIYTAGVEKNATVSLMVRTGGLYYFIWLFILKKNGISLGCK